VRATGNNRTINREKLALDELESGLADPASRRYAVFTRYAHLLRLRAALPAFHPRGEMRVLDAGPSVLALRRKSPDGNERLLCLQNVSGDPQPVPAGLVRALENPQSPARDLVTGAFLDPAAPLQLSPYQTLWAAS
jgi:sucrose phosphorylase